ncbi:unnamed protein product [Cochlearia groenlandica]
MSNSTTNETLENEKDQFDENHNQRTEPSQEWETMAQAWLTSFPDAAVVSAGEVEIWIGSNFDSLPADLRHRPLSELIDRLLSIQHYMRRPTPSQEEENQHPARFQRTDQWLPVYSWLESLENGELVKSKDINEWLDSNPEVKGELSSRHSRYHLTHYVKKCHLKILKRKEKKGLIRLSRATSMEVHKEFGEKQHTPTVPVDPMSNIPKDSELYRTKQKEAKHRFEILVELEKKIAPHFSRPRVANR